MMDKVSIQAWERMISWKFFCVCVQDPEILCWDLREPGRVVFSLKRNVATNQRIYFDLDQ